MFLLGALVVGGALGFTADRVFTQDQVCTAANSQKEARALLAARLDLSLEQARKVDSILDARHEQYEVAMQPIAAQLDSVRERSRTQIRLLLSPDQSQRFDDFIRQVSDSSRKDED